MALDTKTSQTSHDQWLWGWDPTPGIVSVWAEPGGRVVVWRRSPATGELLREEDRFEPWLLLDRLDDVVRSMPGATIRELEGDGSLRYLVSAADTRRLAATVLEGASRRLGRVVTHLRALRNCSPPICSSTPFRF